jgi:hypothetical protein
MYEGIKFVTHGGGARGERWEGDHHVPPEHEAYGKEVEICLYETTKT